VQAQIRHIAISTDNYAHVGRWYQAMFGMKVSSTNQRPEAAVVVTDGYVGMNVIPRMVGNSGRLDHFGFEVPDPELVFNRCREAYPNVHWLKRPAIRPFAGFTMHDPAGNYFDLSFPRLEHRKDIYTDETLWGTKPPRRIHHFQLRVLDPVPVVHFYKDVFGLEELPHDPDDRCHYLSDGTVTMVVKPWNIEDFGGANPESPSMDHLGFVVDSVEQFVADMQRITDNNPLLAGKPLGRGSEGQARLELLQTCRYGHYQIADPDGVLIDLLEGK
jgi:catechol 2,3-dioxygenase-like lactoylglutathione lyase family enzyme